jgi:hypothetical protein
VLHPTAGFAPVGTQLLWGSEATFTNNEGEQKTRQPKLRRMQKKKTKNSFSTVNFSKADPL